MVVAAPTADPLGAFFGKTYPRQSITVDQYARFRRDGFIVVPQLVPQDDIAELRAHTEDLMHGRLPEQKLDVKTAHGHSIRVPEHLSPEEKVKFFLRIHMLHRLIPLHEQYMLHPRV